VRHRAAPAARRSPGAARCRARRQENSLSATSREVDNRGVTTTSGPVTTELATALLECGYLSMEAAQSLQDRLHVDACEAWWAVQRAWIEILGAQRLEPILVET
jgi:hypothetical protein